MKEIFTNKISWGKYLLCAFIVLIAPACHGFNRILDENEIETVLHFYDVEATVHCQQSVVERWNAATGVGNRARSREKTNRAIEYAQFRKRHWNDLWRDVDIMNHKNETNRRQLLLLKQLDQAALAPQDLTNFTQLIASMTNQYDSAKICDFTNQQCDKAITGLPWDSTTANLFGRSRNYDELKYLWTEWHESRGVELRKNYVDYVNVMNRIANINGHQNAGDMWKSYYEDDEFVTKIDRLWAEVEPLYDALHTYMKHKLFNIYGERINRRDPTLPAHVLGDLLAKSWRNLYNDTRPFANATLINVTSSMHELNYTVPQMFQVSDEFFTSLGLPTNNMSFTGDSIIEKPLDRTIRCRDPAWDFCDGHDFRLKMCTTINEEDLSAVHYNMARIQYFIQYKNLPLTMRAPANPAFYDAISKSIELSISTPRHMERINLLKNYDNTFESDINQLYYDALDYVAFLPYGLVVDKWRWDVFSHNVSESRWNEHWWGLRKKYQKISPPMQRNESSFDPGAEYHIVANKEHMRHFVAQVLGFQIYRSLCIAAKQRNPSHPSAMPLHKCDFFESKEAGKKLADAMKLGTSRHWSYVLKTLTNEADISTSALLEYFQPLHQFLVEENRRMNSDAIRPALAIYNEEAAAQCNKRNLANWEKVTDLNNEAKSQAYLVAYEEYAAFVQNQHRKLFNGLKPSDFNDAQIQRQILLNSNLGVYALNQSQLTKLTEAKKEMEIIYNNAAFCDYEDPNCTTKLTLDPEINAIMSHSTDFDRLKYTWLMWHNSTGPLMRNHYQKYVELSNEAARLNNFTDYGDMWRSDYEDREFMEKVENIWKKVQPLYDALHEYTRHKLLKIYGDKMDRDDPLIPAHLLGNMWGQSWVNLFNRIKPFNTTSNMDFSEALEMKEYTPLRIFEQADQFYQSLGLESNKVSYTGKSIIEKPADRVIVCHAQAWDFCDSKDFRIKQCTTVNGRNFVTAHHEMGHIQYYILYKDQPTTFRVGANPAFHEAVGDLIALSVTTPTHLKKIGLLQNYEDTYEDDINALFKMALERVAFLPFGLVIDMYRYGIFNGSIPTTQWNQQWENMRETYQKIRSPANRSEKHFDAGAKFHVPADVQYISYFVAHILEFQLLRSMCEVSGQYAPNNPAKALHRCDFGGSLDAGKRLRDGLSLGRSEHWSVALSKLTGGETEITADALLEYFKPLHEFLVAENAKMRPFDSAWYVVGGVILLIALVALFSCIIYYVNKR